MTEQSLHFNEGFAGFWRSKGVATDGAWCFGSGGTFNAFGRADGRMKSKVPDGAREDVRTAIDAAAAARSGRGGVTAAVLRGPITQPDG